MADRVSDLAAPVRPLPGPRALRVAVVGRDGAPDGAPQEIEPAPVEPAPIEPAPIEPQPAGSSTGPPPSVLVDGMPVQVGLRGHGSGRAVLAGADVGGSRTVLVDALDHGSRGPSGIRRIEVVIDGWRLELTVEPARPAALRDRSARIEGASRRSGPVEVRAIIPGVVVSTAVKDGDAIAAGQRLLVVEAMKMQNELLAPRDGTVRRLAVAAGARVEIGDLLVVID